MKSFTVGAKVKVTASDHPLAEKTGTVRRLRYGDNAAWVNMDDEIPEVIRMFPRNAPFNLGNLALLYPGDCVKL